MLLDGAVNGILDSIGAVIGGVGVSASVLGKWGMKAICGFGPHFLRDDVAEEGRGDVVIVAGGAGFIGSNLCDRLIAASYRVICVDNLDTGRIGNVAHLIPNRDFEFFQHDIVEPFRVRGPVSRIYNLACPASPPKYQRDPLQTFKTSVMGSLNLLDIAEEKGARILQASTSEVYGDPDVTPQSEAYRGSVNTMGPRACYDEGKRAAETLFYEYNKRRGVDTRIARIFNTYGPRMDPADGRALSNFVVQALSGRPLTVYGDGRQTRSFCYVSDMLDALIALMETDAAGSDPVNLGNPDEYSVLELASIVLEMTGASAPLVHEELPRDDPQQRRPDISRAKKRLGWEPKVPLREGLALTIAYFRDELIITPQQMRDHRA